MSHLKFSPEIVGELGGKDVLNALVLELLEAEKETDALDVAKQQLVSRENREAVISALVKKYHGYHMIKDLLVLNRRKISQEEVNAMFKNGIDSYRSHKSAFGFQWIIQHSIDLLKFNPDEELIQLLLQALKEKEEFTLLVDVCNKLGREVILT